MTAQNFSWTPSWTYALGAKPRGLLFARERGWLLAWDNHHWLHLVNQHGASQGRSQIPELVTAAAADDGSAFAAADQNGNVFLLQPDLMPRWQIRSPRAAVALALDSFGQYLAVADATGRLDFLDALGQTLVQVQTPRPLFHLAFVPERDLVAGCADFGLVAVHNLAGQCLWREALVTNLGALAVNGDGSSILVACFSDGIRRYDAAGQVSGRWSPPEPCRLLAQSFDGRTIIGSGMTRRLFQLDERGQVLSQHEMDKEIAHLALDPLGQSMFVTLVDGTVQKWTVTRAE